MQKEVRVRFAPSPTGPLHIGGARSVLFNYLYAKNQKGKLILRIEDTDLERSSRESEENIKASLRWLGLDWDEGIDVGGPHEPYRQTERLDTYQEFTQKLLLNDHAYECFCSEEELEAQREWCRQNNELPRYLNRCRTLTQTEKDELIKTRKPVIRFKVPTGKTIVIQDQVRGTVSFESEGIGDFIIVKSDGIPTYNFAVVIDDVLMDITHIIRGEEHLTNTPRQVLLYEALDLPKPVFAHVSLILGKDRSKMSKRHGDTSIDQYRNKGYLPEALVNFLALMGWSPEGEEEIFNLEELIEHFSLERVSKSPAVFDVDKLNHINGYYLRHANPETLTRLAIPYLAEAGYWKADGSGPYDETTLQEVVKVARNYISCLSEITEHVDVFFNDEFVIEEEKAKESLQGEQVPQVLALLQKKVDAVELEPETVKSILKEICTELELGGKKVFQPIRVALTGRLKGPEMHDLIPILGAKRIAKRIANAMER